MFKYYLYVIARKFLLSVSLKRAYELASFLGKLSYRFNVAGRKQVLANLADVFTDKSQRQLEQIAKANFVNFTKYLVDFLRAQKLDMAFVEERVNFFNDEFLDEYSKESKNFIVVTAHIGNWELGGGVLALRGFNMSAVAKPHLNESTNKFFDRQRDFMAMEVIPLGIAVRRCFKVLKEGKVLALLGDKEFGNGGYCLALSSGQAIIPKGPASLALRFELPIVPAFMVRNTQDNYDFHVEPIISVLDDNGVKRQEEDIAKEYALVIESYIKKFPEQWFMFEPYFLPKEKNV